MIDELRQEGKLRQNVQSRKWSMAFGMTSSLVQLKYWIDPSGSQLFFSSGHQGDDRMALPGFLWRLNETMSVKAPRMVPGALVEYEPL